MPVAFIRAGDYDPLVLDGLDEVRWNKPDFARWARGVANAPDNDDFFDDFSDTLVYDGVLSDDGVAAAPFLWELAAIAPAFRCRIAGLASGIVGPDWETPGRSQQARDAVAARIDLVIPHAEDSDPCVRMYAYLTLGDCGGPAAVLRRRWAVEQDPNARLALLVALGARDPGAVEAILTPAVFGPSPSERLAAVVGLHRAGAPLPAGAATAVSEAIRSGGTLTELYFHDPMGDIIDT